VDFTTREAETSFVFYEDKVIIVVLGKRKNAGTVKFLWGEYVYIVPNFAVIDCTVTEICLVYFA